MISEKEILMELKNLTYEKKKKLIKEKLKSIDKLVKGRIFEKYLAFLFEGNGFISNISGGSHDGGADILLSKPSNPNRVIWIVQAKNTKKSLGNNEIKNELIKFENISSVKYNCKYFMIISLSGYVERVNIFNKTNMSLENFEYIEELIDNYSNKKDSDILLPDLKPHNRYTYKEIKAILEKDNKVAVPNATGTGKSFIIMQLLFDYRDKKFIVLAPTNEILDRLRTTAPWSSKKGSFFTYSKFSSYYSKGKLGEIKADLIILDELHRAGALNWGKAVKYIISENSNAKIVGLSATPIRFLDDNRDMINELFSGVSTTPISLSEAIVRNILPMPIYISAMYNLDKEIEKKLKLMKKLNLTIEDKKKYMEEINLCKKEWEGNSKIENILKKHLPLNKSLKFIVFCENNKHLNEMKSIVVSWFLNVVDGGTTIKEYVVTSHNSKNKEVIFEFENNNNINEIKLLFSISKLNEGIHIKNISGIIMLRNTKSPTIYYQQLGRCLTADNIGNNPIVFDFVDNIDNLELINFRTKIQLSDTLNNMYRRNLGLEEEQVRFSLYEEHENIISKLKNIERKITYNWEKSFESLLRFKEVNQHVNVPKNLEYSRLYSWVSLQRTLYNKGILSEEFIEKLDSIGFIWDINFYKWKENYKKYDRLISNSIHKEIEFYKIINEKYYITVYKYDSLLSEYKEGELLPQKEFIIRWMDKQIKEYQKGNLDKKRESILIKEFKKISQFKENEWLESIYKIISFYSYVNEKYNIDCYLNRIAPCKKNFQDLIGSIYMSKSIIKNTIEKNLPKESKSISFKYINDEVEKRLFVVNLLKDNESIKEIYIDNLNKIYFKDMIELLSNSK